jgi:hypothetical protein
MGAYALTLMRDCLGTLNMGAVGDCPWATRHPVQREDKSMSPRRSSLLFLAVTLGLMPGVASAHCDSLDGPVVQDARVALERGEPTAVLKWVRKEDEVLIRETFKETIAVRAKGSEARALADRYFFETLVRIHRAGEGEGFTGLKPGDSVDPGIAAADKALSSGSGKELAQHLAAAASDGINRRLALVLERKKHAAESVEAGREYVEAYVDFIHFVESVNHLVSAGVSHKHQDGAAATRRPH